MAAEDGLGEEVVDEILGRVLHHRDLLEHDLALGVDVGERRCEDHVRHHVEGTLEMAVGDARVHDRRLARRGCVQLAAHLVEDLGDLLGRVRARALEEQVLDEVRHAGLRVGLVPRARSDPEPERHRAHVIEALGDQPLARVELGDHVLLHREIVARNVVRSCAPGVRRRRVSSTEGGSMSGKRLSVFIALAAAATVAAVAGASSAAGADASSTYLVLYKGTSVPADAAKTIAGAGGTLVQSYDRIGVAVARSASASFADQLGQDKRIEGVSSTAGLATQLTEEVEAAPRYRGRRSMGRSAVGPPVGHGADPRARGIRGQRWQSVRRRR